MMKAAIHSLVWYKGRPALVTELGEKITITFGTGKEASTVKVRDKDIEVLHPGPVSNFAGLAENPASSSAPPGASQSEQSALNQSIEEAWELINSGGVPVSLGELAELVYGEWNPASALAARLLLADGLYFTGTAEAAAARTPEEISAAKEKRLGKAKENQEREAFLARQKRGALDLKEDGRFLQDVEALAYGKTDKSRTMKDLGKTETPVAAHRLLLECGFWNKQINPHPPRFGFPPGAFSEAALAAEAAPAVAVDRETLSRPDDVLSRADLSRLPAFAVDSPWSSDPDDALSVETVNGRKILYVHVADPASLVENGSVLDKRARAAGSTLYLPEGNRPMLGGEILSRFILGGREKDEKISRSDKALTFKLTLAEDGSVEDTEIFPSIVNVTRLTYEEVDALIEKAEEAAENAGAAEKAAVLGELFFVAEKNLERRLAAGAVNIAFPEAHISVREGNIVITPIVPYRSADMVRECMLLAGEGAASWAARRKLAFPYITQQTGDLPAKVLPGPAGSYQLRRCMRPRAVSAEPGYHWGLGLGGYSQVTSPLRRYTDLLAHEQIRAFLYSEAGSGKARPLNTDELLLCLAEGDAAAQAAVQAERASKSHWTAVYLDGLLSSNLKEELIWDAVVTEKRSGGTGIIIPALALETQIAGANAPNDVIKVRLKSVRIPETEINFVQI